MRLSRKDADKNKSVRGDAKGAQRKNLKFLFFGGSLLERSYFVAGGFLCMERRVGRRRLAGEKLFFPARTRRFLAKLAKIAKKYTQNGVPSMRAAWGHGGPIGFLCGFSSLRSWRSLREILRHRMRTKAFAQRRKDAEERKEKSADLCLRGLILWPEVSYAWSVGEKLFFPARTRRFLAKVAKIAKKYTQNGVPSMRAAWAHGEPIGFLCGFSSLRSWRSLREILRHRIRTKAFAQRRKGTQRKTDLKFLASLRERSYLATGSSSCLLHSSMEPS